MINDLNLNEEEQLRAWCVDQVVMSQDSGLPPNVIVDYARILQEHIRPTDKREGGDENDSMHGQNIYAESSDTVKEGPQDFFRTELKRLLNKHSIDNEFNTPDFVLADALVRHLDGLFAFQRDISTESRLR
jgi:hypothetical protein